MQNDIKAAVKELTAMTPPADFALFLNEIQAELIRSGHCESLTKPGAEKFADNFLYLQRFFAKLK